MPWLDKETEMGVQLRQSLIECHMDDDVMTDDELAESAALMLHESLEKAV